MNNPFLLIPLLFKSVRPSRLTDMPAVSNAFWLRKGYEALTFFGHIITATQQEADALNHHYDALKNHEMIHLRQAQTTHDSWLCFYLYYLYFWLRAFPWCLRRPHIAYRSIPFELEAYEHMHNLHYLDDKHNGTSRWRDYARMKTKCRIKLARHES